MGVRLPPFAPIFSFHNLRLILVCATFLVVNLRLRRGCVLLRGGSLSLPSWTYFATGMVAVFVCLPILWGLNVLKTLTEDTDIPKKKLRGEPGSTLKGEFHNEGLSSKAVRSVRSVTLAPLSRGILNVSAAQAARHRKALRNTKQGWPPRAQCRVQ
jgi:hypothetical protein